METVESGNMRNMERTACIVIISQTLRYTQNRDRDDRSNSYRRRDSNSKRSDSV